jgi:hypothetical protein
MILQGEGFDVKAVNAKDEKIKGISPFDLIIVGSGMHSEDGQEKLRIS